MSAVTRSLAASTAAMYRSTSVVVAWRTSTAPAVTIAAAILALRLYGRQLADVDPLHGGAEALLTLSNLLVVLGFTLPARRTPSDPPTSARR